MPDTQAQAQTQMFGVRLPRKTIAALKAAAALAGKRLPQYTRELLEKHLPDIRATIKRGNRT